MHGRGFRHKQMVHGGPPRWGTQIGPELRRWKDQAREILAGLPAGAQGRVQEVYQYGQDLQGSIKTWWKSSSLLWQTLWGISDLHSFWLWSPRKWNYGQCSLCSSGYTWYKEKAAEAQKICRKNTSTEVVEIVNKVFINQNREVKEEEGDRLKKKATFIVVATK